MLVYFVTITFLLFWIDYEQATFRQYQRLTKQIKPNLQEYEAQKEKL